MKRNWRIGEIIRDSIDRQLNQWNSEYSKKEEATVYHANSLNISTKRQQLILLQ